MRGEADFTYDIQRAGLFAVRIHLPEGVDLEEVAGTKMERYELSPTAAGQPPGRVLNLQFAEKSIGKLSVRVAVSQARPDPNADLDLPLPLPPRPPALTEKNEFPPPFVGEG